MPRNLLSSQLEDVLSLKHQFRCITLCFALWIGAGMGAPMPPEKLEELFRQMNEPKVAHTLPVADNKQGPLGADANASAVTNKAGRIE